MTSETTTNSVEPLTLEEHEREMLAEELQALIAALPPDRRQRYEALAATVERGVVPPEEVDALAEVLELLLASGRARHIHRADGERQLEALYDRTPAGQTRSEAQARTNQALRALVNQPITSVRVSDSVTGRHTITIATPALQLTLIADQHGVRLDKVGM